MRTRAFVSDGRRARRDARRRRSPPAIGAYPSVERNTDMSKRADRPYGLESESFALRSRTGRTQRKPYETQPRLLTIA